MHQFKKASALVIAEDLRSTFGSVDDAIASGSRLLGSIVDTARESRLNASDAQRLYEDMASGLSTVVKGRREIVGAMKRMTLLKRQSNLETVDIGCDNPWEAFVPTTGQAHAVPSAAR